MENHISVKQLAKELGIDRSGLRKYILKLGINPVKRITSDSGMQRALTVSSIEATTIRNSRDFESVSTVDNEKGVFYAIQVVPELDPRRIKLGFTSGLKERLAQHRTVAPTAVVLKTWPCKKSWETTVINYLSSQKCSLILNEVFEFEDIDNVIEMGDTIFNHLNPQYIIALSDNSPYKNKK
jgi:hypothetical protein